jgi:Ca2+ transporting ATPase
LKAANNNFEKDEDREVLEQNLTAVGIWGIQDPLRDGIEESILRVKASGIRVIMCTGDNKDTAVAISKNAGIVTKEEAEANDYACMTGKEFREEVGEELAEITDDKGKTRKVPANMKKFKEIFKYIRVLARSSPLDKLILVSGIQEEKGVVAVTGDGTNDAPALK